MTAKAPPKRKPPISDSEHHKRFVDMAKEVGASDDPKDFDRVFKKVVSQKGPRKSQK
jgi:hypothetical protein